MNLVTFGKAVKSTLNMDQVVAVINSAAMPASLVEYFAPGNEKGAPIAFVFVVGTDRPFQLVDSAYVDIIKGSPFRAGNQGALAPGGMPML